MILEIIKREQSLLKMFTGDPHHEAPCGLTSAGADPGGKGAAQSAKTANGAKALPPPRGARRAVRPRTGPARGLFCAAKASAAQGF